ncbi:hypothetical protein CRYUN_Cryun01aG0160000 [Craigia yunnanensis]
MEKGKSAPQAIEISLKKLDLNDDRNSKSSHLIPSLHFSILGFLRLESPISIFNELKATFWPMLTNGIEPHLESQSHFSDHHFYSLC